MDIPLSLYVHIPWCIRKCPYCDFNSHETRGDIPEAAYIEALRADLAADVQHFSENRTVQSIFFGGGTPSLFSPDGIASVLTMIADTMAVAPEAEITLEANPGTLTDSRARFAGYRSAGINRLSIGAQSFVDAQLAQLGRIHTSQQITSAVTGARDVGFKRVNLDIMHGLPGQTDELACQDLAQAISLAPEHLSWYQLTIEPNTVFHRKPPVLPEEQIMASIQDAGAKLIKDAGYERYEVSAFSRPGAESRHNMNYWLFGDYLGIGAGSHGKITTSSGSVTRTSKTRLPKDYLTNPNAKRRSVAPDELAVEFLMNALRLVHGFPLGLFEDRTGLSREILTSFAEAGEKAGMLDTTVDELRPSQRGLDYLNNLLLLADDTIEA